MPSSALSASGYDQHQAGHDRSSRRDVGYPNGALAFRSHGHWTDFHGSGLLAETDPREDEPGDAENDQDYPYQSKSVHGFPLMEKPKAALAARRTRLPGARSRMLPRAGLTAR